MNKGFSQKGQTLIEVLVAIVVAVIIISSIVVLANASNRRANFSRQATQASKLSQEGMELVRYIRDTEAALGVITGPCAGTWNNLYNCSIGTITAVLSTTCPTSCTLTSSPPAAADADTITLGTISFQRTVEISDTPLEVPRPVPLPSAFQICPGINADSTQVKRVTVRVTWNSPSGTQERETLSCLTNH